MARRYLFGPVDATFADQNLHKARQSRECLAFDVRPGNDLTINLTDTWADVCARLPSGWQPDLVALYLPYRTIPPCLWSAPVPVVGLAGDWTLLWHYYRRCLPACDLVLTDTLGIQTLKRAGITQTRLANIYGCERVYLKSPPATAERDIDVLFVGNFSPAIQRERLPWIARLSTLAKRWRVVVTSGAFGDDYRALLSRARVVFNRSIRGECNQRAFEATTSGALLFQEAGNLEMPACFDEGREYVAYSSDNLESLLDHYLEHEEQRREVAEAGQRRAQQHSFENFWSATLDQIAPELSKRPSPLRQRMHLSASELLLQRTWQLLHNPPGADPTLATDIRNGIADNHRSVALRHALAVNLAHSGNGKAPADPTTVAEALQETLRRDPTHVMARLNLAEVLTQAGQTTAAIDQARHALARLDATDQLSVDVLDAAHLPPVFDFFRVEWERAAWANVGQPAAEMQAKRTLLRWQLHALIANLTSELTHFYEATSARPDLPSTQALLGWTLSRSNYFAEAVPHLQRALDENPFDLPTATALYDILGEAGAWPRQHQLAQRYWLLHRAAPTVVPERPWFAAPPGCAGSPKGSPNLGSIVWEGWFEQLHSFALVNRELCLGLIERGYDVSLRPAADPRTQRPELPLPASLAKALNRPAAHDVAVHVRHQWPPSWQPPPQGRWVVIQPWEYGSIPLEWLEPMRTQVDEIWVPSNWVRACYIHCGVPAARVHVVPNGVNVDFLQRRHSQFPLRTKKRFKFLFVGGTIYRKGIDALLQAYRQAFTHADDVCLVIKDAGDAAFYQGQTAEKQIAALQTESAPEIEYLARDLSAEEMAALYQACDCLVHPYRGEGFGLPIAEAMACSLPVIVTGHGAALDFCDDSRAFLLPARLGRLNTKGVGEIETVDYPWLAEPDQVMLRYYLRYVVEHPDEAKAKGAVAAAFIRENFSWDRAVDAVAARIEHLAG